MQKKTKKTVAAMGAVLVAATLVLGSTLAWQSTNQVARNKKFTATNPGGRLHDDYNGTNKDIYVENFGENDLAVRVQLREFMETGPDAGKESGEKRVSVDSGTRYNDPDNWPVHVPTSDTDLGQCSNGLHRYVTYQFGGKTTYLPTFNMNKDSLAPDINGTYEGTSPDDDIHFDDYVDYTTNQDPVTGDEVLDADDNTEDEGNGALGGKGGEEGTNYKLNKSVQHTPTETLESEVITMATWKKSEDEGGKGGKPGNYWVYDTDGWAYWANPLPKKTATGLFLTEAKLTQKPSDDYFYAIEVICQMTSIGDLGEFYKDGFYDPVKGTEPTEDAKALLEAMGGTSIPKSLKDQIIEAEQKGAGDENLTVTIDGVEFYVTKITDDNKALLLAKNHTGAYRQFKTDTSATDYWKWENSDERAYMNGEWLSDKPTIKRIAEDTVIYTRNDLTGASYTQTTDKIFAISEADYNGTLNNSSTSEVKEYSLGVAEKLVIPNQASGSWYYWGRTPYSSLGNIFKPYAAGSFTYDGTTHSSTYSRPAFIVDIS